MNPLLRIALDLAPTLGGLFGGPMGSMAAGVAVKVAEQVFGTSDPVQVQQQMQADPAKAEEFKSKLEIETEHERDMFELQVQDAASARAQTIALAQSGSLIAWGAPVVSAIIVLGYFAVMFILLTRKVDFDAEQLTMLNILFGALQTMVVMVPAYWLGSSAGSANKDRLIAATTSQPTVVERVVDKVGKAVAAARRG